MIKKVVLRIMMKRIVNKNMLSTPKFIQLPGKRLIGYKLITTLKNNQQKEDIPPFFHEIYDNNKLSGLQRGDELKMHCLFSMHENQENFDYYIAVENPNNIKNECYDTLQLKKGAYITVDFIKRNNKAVHLIMMYLRNVWMQANGCVERKAPAFILYDNRFHSNYAKYGCKGDDYLGNPLATLFLPVET